MLDMDSLTKTVRDPHTYDLFMVVYWLVPVFFVIALLVVDAPYGRFGSRFGFEFGFSRRTSKFAWMSMEAVSPLVLYATLNSVLGLDTSAWTSGQALCIALWTVHYVNRSVIHPLRCTSMAPMHALAWLMAIVFNIINGYTNGYWLATHTVDLAHWRVVVGAALWLAGLVGNIYHDNLLFSLRKRTTAKESGKKRYVIPRGGLFHWLSAPNYVAETVEWIGFYIICGDSTPALLFALSTAANLLPRAYSTHQWYKKTFSTYPKQRRAIIPYVF
ncbi:3-oxo-5-alpha-steroid 4-dehydrogenase-domain-containing protein [Gongronella butleri]|nr:3-oxo-5-alpha-steroid 4-dehydrogenase-domain-containing protein [Gongronella butleri]